MNVGFWVFTVSTFGIALWLFRRQNHPGRIGGPIALSKAFWLHYTLYTWFFFVPYALLKYGYIPAGDRALWWLLTVSMWTRGVVELYMLFVSKNWTPVIGISHDFLTLAAMLVGYSLGERAGWSDQPGICAFTWSLIASLVAEIHHAVSFYQLMKGRTQGSDGLWYAHKGDPRFVRILRVTTAGNIGLYATLAYFIWTWSVRMDG